MRSSSVSDTAIAGQLLYDPQLQPPAAITASTNATQ